MVPLFGVPYRPTPTVEQFRADVQQALLDANLSRKVAAGYMRLTEGALSRQLTGYPGTHLSLWRLAQLPDAFWDAFDARRAERRGAVLLTPRLVELLRGAANLKRDVVKAVLPPQKAKRAL